MINLIGFFPRQARIRVERAFKSRIGPPTWHVPYPTVEKLQSLARWPEFFLLRVCLEKPFSLEARFFCFAQNFALGWGKPCPFSHLSYHGGKHRAGFWFSELLSGKGEIPRPPPFELGIYNVLSPPNEANSPSLRNVVLTLRWPFPLLG